MKPRSLRVLFFTQYYPPEVGATQNRMQTFARHLVERGHEVTVVTEIPNHPQGVVFEGWRNLWLDRRIEDGVEVFRLRVYTSPQKSFYRRCLFYGTYALGAGVVGSILAHRSWDAVFATSPPLPAALPGWWTARLSGAPFIMDVRDIWPAIWVASGEMNRDWAVRVAETVERFLYRAADAVTCVTRSFMEHVRNRGGDHDSVYFLPNGTVPELFSPEHTDPSLRERLGLEDGFVVGYYGLHGLVQGLPSVLKAAAKLQQRAEEVRFLLVGDGPVKEDLVREARSRNLNNVLFHDQVPLEEIAAWINAADMMLVPLADDPILQQFVPSKLYDYLACGTPVVLSANGEAREILESCRGGCSVPPEDPEALAETVAHFASDPSDLEEMGRRGRDYVLRHYTREKQSDRLATLLKSIADNGPFKQKESPKRNC